MSYRGTLDVIITDEPGTPFSGTPAGSAFAISTSSVNPDGSFASGIITGAGTSAAFNCPLPTIEEPSGEERCSPLAAGPSFDNDQILDLETATLLNTIFGAGTFSAGESYDIVEVEGDSGTVNDRVEVGFSFVFPPGTYNGGPRFQAMTPPFDATLATHTVFFIVAEESDAERYNALGAANAAATLAVPVPLWALLGAAVVVGIAGIRAGEARLAAR